ncbi:MAG: hypothetical protein VB859_21060 [Planctomycetaceae bacterium]
MRRRLFLFCCCVWPAVALAAPPKISQLSVRGFQVGGTTRLVVRGADLLPLPRLVAGVPIAKQAIVGKSTAKQITVDVTLAANVVPGVYHLRVANQHGLSNPQIVTLDHLPQRPVAGVIDSLPVALHGRLSGSQVISTRFQGKAGQQVTIDLMARRLGSTIKPVLHLYDARGRQLALSLPRPDLAGDTRISARLPADGVYEVKWHDLQYAAGNPGDYRLAIGTFDTADLVFPPSVSRGQKTPVLLLGTAGTETVSVVDVEKTAWGFVPVAWHGKSRPVGLRPRVEVSRVREIVEPVDGKATRILPTVPAAASGRILKRGEADRWQVVVRAGQKLRFEVFADRLGTPLDSMLELRRPAGAVLATNDDAVRSDSRIDYTVPAGVNRVDALVSDRHGRGGSRFVYRLLVSRTTDPARPEFSLTVAEGTHNVLSGGRHVFRVDVSRRGYNGAIRLLASKASGAFELLTPQIPAGAPGALVTVIPAVKDGQAGFDDFELVGVSVGAKEVIQRPVRTTKHPIASLQPWLAGDLAVARAAPPAEGIGVSWKTSGVGTTLFQGQDRALPIVLSRGTEAIGPIRLSLVTSQQVPLTKGKPNAALAIRGAKATVEIPVAAATKSAWDAALKARTSVRALEKKLAAAGAAVAALKQQLDKARGDRDEKVKALRRIVAGQTRDAVFSVVTPPGLNLTDYDLAVLAELRSLDNKTTVARSFTPVKRFGTRRSLELVPRSADVVFVARSPKVDATVGLQGEITRHGTFAGDVTVTVAGQPKGIAAPKIVIKPGQTRFTLPLKVPGTFAAARIDNLAIVVSGPPNPKAAAVVVQARQTVTVILGTTDNRLPPPPTPRSVAR